LTLRVERTIYVRRPVRRTCYKRLVDRYEIRPGISTRTVRLSDGSFVSFAAEAVADSVEQVRQSPLPLVVEHLNYLPPLGWITDGEVVVGSDGESDAVWRGHAISQRRIEDLTIGRVDLPATEEVPNDLQIEVSAEPRNFEPNVWQEIKASSPAKVREYTAWSDLPPIVWAITVMLTWGGAKFAGAFLEDLGTASGKRVAEWIASASRRSREQGRDALVELRLELPTTQVLLGYCPVSASGPESIADLEDAFAQTVGLSDFASSIVDDGRYSGLLRAAFVWDSGSWRLGWWATATEVYVTEWFTDSHPDPERFLGRPLTAPVGDAPPTPSIGGHGLGGDS